MDFFDDCRPFTSGSREPPDEQDGFLETTGYYRKHTARDPTSLFGVVSEHVFDIQLYHDKVREDCANYLEKNRKDYEKEMDKNFDHYLSNLRKLATPGTLLELRALAHCYKRNVMIFEPFTAGKWYIEEDEYRVSKPILIFYTADKHFDSIYRKNIELAAKCQDVFQLPDVSKPLKDDPDKYEIVSGKIVEFDSHQTTSCVLENSLMCHFHNRSNFRKFVDSTGRSRKPLDDIIYDEKIAPFSYKVDKALDRSIHSNIEFDLWNDVSILFSWFYDGFWER
jgi:OTU domain-containing protein 4